MCVSLAKQLKTLANVIAEISLRCLAAQVELS